MKSILFRQLIIGLLFLAVSMPSVAVNSVATVNVKISRFLSITNISDMRFGDVSINSVAGAVMLKSDGTREYAGGILLNNEDAYSPAKFVIEGVQNADYSISYPDEIVLSDGNGNTVIVDQITTEMLDVGESGSSGLKELVVGARLNLDAYQAIGDYSGSLVVEVEYR